MLVVAALWAVTGTVDRIAVLGSSPSFYGAALSLALGVGFPPAALRDRSADAGGPALRDALVRRPGPLAVQGLIFAAMFVAQMEALRLAIAAYVLSIKRSGTLLAVFLGGSWFEESGTGREAAATLVLLAEAALVATS